MRPYTHLTQHQRYQIAALLKANVTQKLIAEIVGVHRSTISREIRRNRGRRGYRPAQAHRQADARRHNPRPRITPEAWRVIEFLLREHWSPEQISRWMKDERKTSVSHEYIYQYIYADKRAGGTLHEHLRWRRKRRKRYGSHSRRGQIPNRISIDERPRIVDSRRRFGDWEADTIIGKNHRHAIVSLTERKSRLALIRKVERRSAEEVEAAIVALLEPLKKRVHTITSDNGKEFTNHESIAESLEASFYFAHPYASWQRGLNENTNGLIRQYFPKGSDFSSITPEDIERVMEKLNNRPRKSLDFKSPNHVFFGIKHNVALQC